MTRRTLNHIVGIALLGGLAAFAVHAPPLTAHADQKVTITGFTLVETERVNAVQDDATYTVTVTNHGGLDGEVANVTVRISSRWLHLWVVDGDELSVGLVPSGATVTSRETFTVRKLRGVRFNPAHLRFDLSWRPDLVVPASWVGTWHVDIEAFDAVSGNLETQDTYTEMIFRPDDTVGLSLIQKPARCHGKAAGDRIDVRCQLVLHQVRCGMKGEVELSAVLEGDTLHGSGSWAFSARGDCGPLVEDDGQLIEFTARRTSHELATQPYESPPTLAAKFVSSPFLPDDASLDPDDPPRSKDHCRDDRWRRFRRHPFLSQWHCHKYVERQGGGL